jgi:hypothetical protein
MHRLRRGFIALFAGVTVAVAAVGVTAPAQAEPGLQSGAADAAISADSGSEAGTLATSYRLKNVANNLCLRAGSSSNLVWSTPGCSTTSSLQRWTITHEGGGRYQIRNVGNGWCLDGNSTRIYTHACNTGSYQDWYRQGAYPYRFMNAATGKCLDNDSNGNVYPHSCNTGNYQKWRLYNP